MKSFLRLLNYVLRHPLTRNRLPSTIIHVLRFQLISKVYPYPFIYPWIENSKLIVKKGMTGATGNIYAGLHEFEEMAFLLHLLRRDDVFGDIGANIGAYTILASAVVNAKSITVEPIPSTFKSLTDNIKINNIENLVSAYNNGVGSTEGSLRFTKNLDTVNHVIAGDATVSEETVEVPVVTLDFLFSNHLPALLKIDVEGFELNVLKGGKNILNSSYLKAIIIELNGSGNRYGILDETVHQLLLSYNFFPYSYSPINRDLIRIPRFLGNGNTIYIKDRSFVQERILQSRKYSLLGKSF